MTKMAEMFVPPKAEVGQSVVGAWISCIAGRKEIRIHELEKLRAEISDDADVSFPLDGIRIEMPLPISGRSDKSIMATVKTIRSAIQKSFGIVAGLCPVQSSAQIIRVTRAG